MCYSATGRTWHQSNHVWFRGWMGFSEEVTLSCPWLRFNRKMGEGVHVCVYVPLCMCSWSFQKEDELAMHEQA